MTPVDTQNKKTWMLNIQGHDQVFSSNTVDIVLHLCESNPSLIYIFFFLPEQYKTWTA